MRNRFITTHWLLGWLLGWLTFNTCARAECGPGTIALKKTSQRDWVKDFNKLNTTSVPITRLKAFFYDKQNKPKECISLTDLQRLNEQITQVQIENNQRLMEKGLKGVSQEQAYQRDLTRLVNGIAVIARTNKKDQIASSRKATTLPAENTLETDTTLTEEFSEQKSTTLPTENTLETDTTLAESFSESDQIDQFNEQKDQRTEDRKFWQRLSVGLLILALLLGGLLSWRYQQARREIRQLKESHSREMQQMETKIRKLQAQITHGSDQGRTILPERKPNPIPTTLSPRTDELTNPTKVVRTEDNLNISADAGSPDLIEETNAVVRNDIPVTEFFLSMPFDPPEGPAKFLDRRQAQLNISSSVYRFQLLPDDGNEAKFWFEDEPAIVRAALVYPQQYLQPACQYDGLNTRAQRIITEKPGRAVLVNGSWQVTTKAIIRFV